MLTESTEFIVLSEAQHGHEMAEEIALVIPYLKAPAPNICLPGIENELQVILLIDDVDASHIKRRVFLFEVKKRLIAIVPTRAFREGHTVFIAQMVQH